MNRRKSRLRAWLIHRLGGYTGEERMIPSQPPQIIQGTLSPRKYQAAYTFFAHQEAAQARQAIQNARGALAEKLGRTLMEDGAVSVRISCEPNQDGQPVKRMRITGTVWTIKREERGI